jgi:hypothetical protein
MVASPNDRRYLHRGNDRDVLKPTHEPEHEWLRIERRVRIERWRWRQYVVHPALDRIPAGQRTVQLIKQNQTKPGGVPARKTPDFCRPFADWCNCEPITATRVQRSC